LACCALIEINEPMAASLFGGPWRRRRGSGIVPAFCDEPPAITVRQRLRAMLRLLVVTSG
jgi:hypothetical protein